MIDQPLELTTFLDRLHASGTPSGTPKRRQRIVPGSLQKQGVETTGVGG